MSASTDLPWKLQRQALQIGKHQAQIDLIADQDELLNELLAKGQDHPEVQDERVPYWGELWPSALGMSQYLAQAAWMDGVNTVHEIGCGLALPGIVTGFHGCEVILSDYLEGALTLARHNWHLNHSRPVRTEIVDWRTPDLSLSADLLLASDVAYEQRAFEPLVNTFRSLCKPGGRILLAEPGRDRARPFLQRLPAEGFSVQDTILPVRHKGLSFSINILLLQPIQS